MRYFLTSVFIFLSLFLQNGNKWTRSRVRGLPRCVSCEQANVTQTIDVPIVNPSFEAHPVPLPFPNQCGSRGWNDIPGWLFTTMPGSGGTYGVFQPDVSTPPTWPCYNVPPPDGSTVAVLQDAVMAQDLGVVSAIQTYPGLGDGDGIFVASVFFMNTTNAYPGYYEVKLLVGPPFKPGQSVYEWLAPAHELCGVDGWGRRTWDNVLLVCPSPSYLIWDNWPPTVSSPVARSNPNDHLIISLSNAGGWGLLVDNVSLKFKAEE